MLGSASVAERVRGQMDVGQMGSKLKKCLRASEQIAKTVVEPMVKLSAYREQRDTVMDYAKLTGQLVEKREITTIDAQAASAIRDLVAAAMPLQASSLRMPSTPKTATENGGSDAPVVRDAPVAEPSASSEHG